jgi:hypothetical protein
MSRKEYIMAYRTFTFFLIFTISMHAFFNGRDPFTVHFDEFDDIINQMKSFRKELKTLEQNLTDIDPKEHKNHPTVAYAEDQKNLIITIKNIPLTFEQKDISIDANISYDQDDRAQSVHLTAGDYKIDIYYNENDQYISTNIMHQSSTKKEEKDSKLSQASHYHSRKVQTIRGKMDIEKLTVVADHAHNSITVTILQKEEKSRHKKVSVSKAK